MDVVIIGLVITVLIAATIVVLVALPGLRAEGRLRAGERDRFRLPQSWTGYDSTQIRGFFGDDEDTSQLATREQHAVTAMQEHTYSLRPQAHRHSVPPLLTFRPRTRHWKVPESGEGFSTTMRLLFR